ncbi:MAG: D-alanyl-D-alanine carboxypeptidase family protein [Eubacteriales bacterium]
MDIRVKEKRIQNLIRMMLILVCVVITWQAEYVYANEEMPILEITSPSVILMEVSTGEVLYEASSEEMRAPASITKIMSLILIFEAIENGSISLTDEVTTSEYAKSMSGSKVYLETGEIQTVETLIKCIVIPSGNDACVAMAEYIAGSEESFVEQMNVKAEELGMVNTHFVDCCGLTESSEHYTTAMDVAIMSRELITTYPAIYEYTNIWMEDIVHTTAQGSKEFTLSSTNKLLQLYDYTTGLKTGYTSLAMHCISATANRDGIDLIAVILGAPSSDERFNDAMTLLDYGFSISQIYTDVKVQSLPELTVEAGASNQVGITYAEGFTYLDTTGADLTQMEKEIVLEDSVTAPIEVGDVVGKVSYILDGVEVGSVPITCTERVLRATYGDYIKKVWMQYILL